MLPPAKVTNIMMSDLQRIRVYAARGFSAPQQIPDDVKQAFHRLIELGFTEHLIGETERQEATSGLTLTLTQEYFT